MSILVLNAGSSSLKFSLFESDPECTLASGQVAWDGKGSATLSVALDGQPSQKKQVEVHGYDDATRHVMNSLNPLLPGVKAVGQRVVHGGNLFRESVTISDEVKQAIRSLFEVAPLHNPPALDTIHAVEKQLPGIPQIAVFDTAFFASLPPENHIYPLPYDWYTNWNIRRYGFHGISHHWCWNRASELLPKFNGVMRIVTCHLGNGCSITATRDGKALSTTMGFTPLDGVMMGTRTGSIDPGILTFVMQQKGLTPDQVSHILNHDSGLLGVSGISSDFRDIESAMSKGSQRAALAFNMFAIRVKSAIGSLSVLMGGLDALVFSAGIGEHSDRVRESVCAGLDCLGISLDKERNSNCIPDSDIASVNSTVPILVLHTQEELMIAREARRLLILKKSVS